METAVQAFIFFGDVKIFVYAKMSNRIREFWNRPCAQFVWVNVVMMGFFISCGCSANIDYPNLSIGTELFMSDTEEIASK